jgi:hypothetical protein
MGKRIALVVGGLPALAFAAFVWPTLYRYRQMDDLPVRENRITGSMEYRLDDRWLPLVDPRGK